MAADFVPLDLELVWGAVTLTTATLPALLGGTLIAPPLASRVERAAFSATTAGLPSSSPSSASEKDAVADCRLLLEVASTVLRAVAVPLLADDDGRNGLRLPMLFFLLAAASAFTERGR